MSTSGLRFLSAVVTKGSVKDLVKYNLYDELFHGSELTLFQLIKNHVASYGVLPSEHTIQDSLGEVLVPLTEPAEYYLHELEKRKLQESIKSLVVAATDNLKEQLPEDAYELLFKGISEIHKERHRNNLSDFRDAVKLVKEEYVQKLIPSSDNAFRFGWPKLDKEAGAIGAGDFVTVVGRPSAGKTFQMLYCAHNHWKQDGLPLVVSMEMRTTIIMQRLAALHSHKNLTHLLNAMMSTPAYKDLLKDLKGAKAKDKPFWIVDGQMATKVADIALLVRQLKPSAVVIDGAYLLGHSDHKLNRFSKITENAEALKQAISTQLEVPVIASYQFNRESSKGQGKGKDTSSSKGTMDDVYGSDAMAQLSTIMIGLSQPDTVETKKQRRVDILKGRNGGAGSFYINWDFHRLNFDQVPDEEKTSNMQFL